MNFNFGTQNTRPSIKMLSSEPVSKPSVGLSDGQRMPLLRKNPLTRHKSESIGLGLSNRLRRMSLFPQAPPQLSNIHNVPGFPPENIRRRESLFKSTLESSLDHGKLTKDRHSNTGRLKSIGKHHSRELLHQVDKSEGGWSRTDRGGTTFLPQFLTTPGKVGPRFRRSSLMPNGQMTYKHLLRGGIPARPSALTKSNSMHSLVSLEDKYLTGNRRRSSHKDTRASNRQFRKQKTFPQLVKKISLVTMLGRSKRMTAFHIERSRRSAALERFRRAGRMVQLLLRAVNDIKSNYALRKKRADEVLAETPVVLPGSSAESSLKNSGLMFNPADFKTRTEGQLGQEAKRILSKSPDNRTPEEIRVVQMGLHSAMEVFSEFPIKMQESLAKAAWYESFEPERVIIRQGHKSEIYYLILSGTAVVTVSSSEYGITGDPGIKHVAFLKKGNSFGEIALMHHAKRAATVVCKDTVELLAIDREDFINIFMHRNAVGKPDFIQFLHTIPELQGWPLDKLPDNDPKICLFTFFRRGVVICKDINHSDWIYVVKTGSCRVLKKLGAPTELFEARSALMDVFELANGARAGVTKSSLYSPREGNRQRSLTYPHGKLQPMRAKTAVSTCSSIKLPKISVDSSIQQRPPLKKIESKLQMDLPDGPIRPKVTGNPADEKMVYLQIQQLSPKDIFGLQPVVFQGNYGSTSVTLVSDGAECVLVSKRFFLQHLTGTHRNRLEKSMRCYPSEESLQYQLKQQTSWEQYKCRTMQKAIYRHSKVNEIMLKQDHCNSKE